MPRLRDGLHKRLKCSFTLKPSTYELLQKGSIDEQVSIGVYAERLVLEALAARELLQSKVDLPFAKGFKVVG